MTVTTAPTAVEPLSTNHRRLDEEGTRRVEALARDVTCRCGASEFAIGDALDMGSIWPDEDLGTYMVALTCLRCGAHDGLRVYDL